MLALTRKQGQSIVIGDSIEVTIVEIKGEQVKIAVKAPKEIPIHRKEVYELIQQENRQAACLPDQGTITEIIGLWEEKDK